MITENELQQLQPETLDRAILRVVSDNEPVKKHSIPEFGMGSWSRNEIFTQIAAMKEQKLLDVGDVEEGFIVMLTPEGRAALQAFEGCDDPGAAEKPREAISDPNKPEDENAGSAPEPGNGKKSLIRRVVDFLVLHPGSTRDQLKKRFPDELKALSVALCEGRRNDRIAMRKDGEIETFHPGPNALAKSAPICKPLEEKRQRRASFPALGHDGERIDCKTPAAAKPQENIPIIPPEKPEGPKLILTPEAVELSAEDSQVLVDFIVDEC